ncbi:MAG: hypothetical protein KatS3mg060_0389 [Dehalococcoidia bacterium]|nr:MAG: hypothetical protein KatS3mg060_0389 [Dehalococcoidia bacterium]
MKSGCAGKVLIVAWIPFGVSQLIQASVLVWWIVLFAQAVVGPDLPRPLDSVESSRAFWQTVQIAMAALGFSMAAGFVLVPLATAIVAAFVLMLDRGSRGPFLLVAPLAGGAIALVGLATTVFSEATAIASPSIVRAAFEAGQLVSADVASRQLLAAIQLWLGGNAVGLMLLVFGSILLWAAWFRLLRLGIR